MEYWTRFKAPTPLTVGTKIKYDDNIYTFDIETSSYLILFGRIINSKDYLKLTKSEREEAVPMSNMYIWQFSINENVYYGRTWYEFVQFIKFLNVDIPERKIIFIHNASFEFQYLKSVFKFDEVLARKAHKVMKAVCKDYNFEIRCTYMMSNCSLAYLPELYGLNVKKLVGDLEYTKIRHANTPLTETELAYCEHDCLVVYKYILKEKEDYLYNYKIPLTSTGHVRREFKELIISDYSYKNKVRKAVNTDPHVYNMLLKAFMGGYTHANWIYSGMLLEEIDSWDFTSSYPYCLVAFQYPSTAFKPCKLRKITDMINTLAYLVTVKIYDLDSKYYNNILSQSKCIEIKSGKYDNGRVMSAEYVVVTMTDIDIKLILEWYNYSSIEIIESYFSVYKYLPIQYVDFILEKYINKTKFKGVKGKELLYAKEKNKFNSLYGMAVTNNIRDEVLFNNELEEWEERPLTNNDILDCLEQEKKQGFLSFAYGVWCTAYARNNLLRNLMKLDEYAVYCDTDSIKCIEGYDKKVIDEYNNTVLERLKHVSELRDIDISKFSPEDSEGIKHPLGVFDFDGHYEEFITQGAKKYAVRYFKNIYGFKKDFSFKKEHPVAITVSGVPKSGFKCLKNDLNNFNDGLVFDNSVTNKNILFYCDNMQEVKLTDYVGNTMIANEKSGCCVLPTTYVLGKSDEYADLIDSSSKRAYFKERK